MDIAFLCEWEDASEAWLNSPDAVGYPGGKRNRWLMHQAVTALGIQEARDKQNALTTAFKKLSELGMLDDGNGD